MFPSACSMRIASMILALIIAAPAAIAQTRRESNLRVTVVDPSGAAIAGAKVILKSSDGRAQTAGTDARGEANVANLVAGPYELHIEAAGFESRELRDGLLKAGSNKLEIRLEVARVKEEVEVTRDERERATDPRGNSFSTILTPEQIAA
ncbi:MAG TPA: carboxypeptidase-like regulatory domain-containing protein, partial [Blastocatellia bacterium]|nr:carboxypeptidase-like regulatory domain-containing protein [Blastocatellia bacterium]